MPLLKNPDMFCEDFYLSTYHLINLSTLVEIRLSAREIAWPSSYSFTGPRENTKWAIQKAAISDVSLVIMVISSMLLVSTLLVAQIADRSNHEGRKFEQISGDNPK